MKRAALLALAAWGVLIGWHVRCLRRDQKTAQLYRDVVGGV